MITMKEFISTLENLVSPLAKENSEGSYDQAKQLVRKVFNQFHLPLTERQVISFVNRVWDRTCAEVAK